MKADFHPRVEFFLAMARFNQFVADQDLKSITVSKLRDRLKGAAPLVTDTGQLYGATEFFGLFTGLLGPPNRYAQTDELTQDDVSLWTETMRDNFRKISLTYMCSRAEAWQLLIEEIRKVCATADFTLGPDDETWIQEVLSGLHDPGVEETKRYATRTQNIRPLQEAISNLINPERSKKHSPIA